jgi:hypothetical protein
MNKLSDLERVFVGLQSRCSLLQSSQGKGVGGAQVVLVAVLMDGAIGPPTAGALPSLRIAVGSKADLLSDEAE